MWLRKSHVEFDGILHNIFWSTFRILCIKFFQFMHAFNKIIMYFPILLLHWPVFIKKLRFYNLEQILLNQYFFFHPGVNLLKWVPVRAVCECVSGEPQIVWAIWLANGCLVAQSKCEVSWLHIRCRSFAFLHFLCIFCNGQVLEAKNKNTKNLSLSKCSTENDVLSAFHNNYCCLVFIYLRFNQLSQTIYLSYCSCVL